MTNPNLTYVQLIVDRSGSMGLQRTTVVEGLNNFLAAQRKLPGVCHVGLCLFGDVVDRTFDNKPLTDVKDLVAADYVPFGGTPLHEAICTTIDQLGARLAALPEADRPGLVTVLTITDGEENTSAAQYTAIAVKERIDRQTKQYGWNFQYLGANQDAVVTARKYGIGTLNAGTYTMANTGSAFAAMSASTSRGRNAVLRGCSLDQAAQSMAYSVAEVESLTKETP